MTNKWKRTVEAAKAEESSAWSVIWAMAEEAFDRDPTYKNITSGPVIGELRLELEEAGIELKFETIKNRAGVAKFVHGARKRDADVLRSVPWSVVAEGAAAGATAEAVAAFIRDCRRDKAGPPTQRAMRDRFRVVNNPERAPEPKFSDDKYMAAVATPLTHTMAERNGEYTPGPTAKLAGALAGEILTGRTVDAVDDWDEQLNNLLAAEGGHG